MKTLIATLLATAAGASFAAAPTAALNHDPATYRNATQKASSEYNAAAAKCNGMNGNDKDVCMAEARLVRTRIETEALSQYSNSPAARVRVRSNLADAEYAVAKAKCDAKSGADKDSCVENAKSAHTAALADAKADRVGAAGAAANAAADKCAQAGGDAKTGCLIQTKPSPVRDSAAEVANRTGNAADDAADKTRAAASTAALKTRDAAATAAEKTKAVAATAAEKTKEVALTAVEKTKQAASTVAQKTDNAVDHAVVSDTAITAKVKAGLVKAPKLDSLGIHVETERGVVMLSGFVDSKTEADQAVKVAKDVDGVTSVKSAIKVK